MQRNRLKKTVMEKIVPFDIRQIVQASELADGTKLKTRKFASGPKSLRQGLLQSEPDTENGEICAALEIQRVWRGYRSRCKLFEILQEGISEMAVYGGSKHYMARQEDFTQKGPKKTRGRQRLEQFYQDYLESLGPMALADNIATFQDFCANYIQNWYRAKKYRKPYVLRKGILPTKKPALVPKEATPDPDIIPKNKAAIIIQRAWRRHIDMQVYKYYRDLINFKTRGDPSLMLRCINPNEAKLLDPALGVHVRFRLAGTKFPPNIYYKIFTHRPIVDMCANSPKDYTRATAKQVIMRDVHNNTSRITPTVVDKDGWYQRVENNGWRLVSDRLISHIMNDPLTWESSQKRIEFHHTKLQRKQDVEKKKKHKKIQWMKKMYKDGLLKAKSHDPETVQLIEGAAAGMVSAADRDGPDALEEWEVDELLDWTTSLNFEEYMVSWKEIATSANSENSVEERLKVTSDNIDPYELTVSMDPSYRYSARQSAHENTPASSMTNLLLHV